MSLTKYPRLIQLLITGCSLLLPLKFSLFLIPLSILTLFFIYSLIRCQETRNLIKIFWQESNWSYLVLLILYLLLITPFGVNPIRSLAAIGTKMLVVILPVIIFWCFHATSRTNTLAPKASLLTLIITGLITGQLIAAIHSLFQVTFPLYFHKWFLGEVTESGQLVITIIVTLGMMNAPSYCSESWLLKNKKIIAISLFILITALIINLKRGPWAGCLVGILLFVTLERKYNSVLFVIIATLSCLLVEPVRDRIASSLAHFFIHGGRSELWEIGLFLHRLLPLGLGFANSRYLHEYTEEIPPELTHFHSNPIHILAESGWIGMSLLIWWLVSSLYEFFTTTNDKYSETKIILNSYLSAIIGWQIAGLVEYNLGDSEVLYLAIFILGLGETLRLLSIKLPINDKQNLPPTKSTMPAYISSTVSSTTPLQVVPTPN